MLNTDPDRQMSVDPQAGQSPDIHVVFYDGTCGLCSRTVRFVLTRDAREILTFAPLQGETFTNLARTMSSTDGPPTDLDTIVFVEHLGTPRQRLSTRSTAVLRILARLGGIWRLVSRLRVVPAPLRDLAYGLVARIRYRVFGRLDRCEIPVPAERHRFLD